jgi:thiamine biosynthesis lipoprotein
LSRSRPKLPANKAADRRRYGFEAIGTVWQIDLYESLTETQFQQLSQQIEEQIEQFDKVYSRFRVDSLICQMSQRPGRYELPDDAAPMLALYHELYRLSDGAVTPLVGRLLADAGYDAKYSLQPGELRPVSGWDEVLDWQSPFLTLKQPALLDVGALGKGYLVDLIAAIIERYGIEAYCVDAGGDMFYRRPSGPVAKIGLEHPDDPSQAIGVVELAGGGLCGSAGNRRSWDRFHHIMDPRTQASPRHLKAVWVTADSTMLADGLSTALYFVGAERLAKRYTFEYAMVKADNSLEYSLGFPADFF